jgi:hypothetical protein
MTRKQLASPTKLLVAPSFLQRFTATRCGLPNRMFPFRLLHGRTLVMWYHCRSSTMTASADQQHCHGHVMPSVTRTRDRCKHSSSS